MKRRAGFSLIELLVALLLSSMVMAGAAYVTVSTSRAKSETMRSTRVTQGLRDIALLMGRDMQRSGAWEPMPGVIRATQAFELTFTSVSEGSAAVVTPGQLLSNIVNKYDPDTAWQLPTDFTDFFSQLNFDSATHDPVMPAQLIVYANGTPTAGGTPTVLAYRAVIGTTGNTATSLNITWESDFPGIETTLSAPNILNGEMTVKPGAWSILPPTRGVAVRSSSNSYATEVAAGNTGDCVVYQFDGARNGTIEDHGYRFDPSTGSGSGAIQMRQTVSTAAGCAGGAGWVDMTDTGELHVSSFGIRVLSDMPVSIDSTCGVETGLQAVVRTYEITIAGCAASERTSGAATCAANTEKTVQELVRVRNDHTFARCEKGTLESVL